MTEISGLTGVEDAMTALTALETERAAVDTTPASANTDQRADQLDGLGDAEAQLNQLTDTPATAEPTATEVQAVAKTDAAVETQVKPETEAKGSKLEQSAMTFREGHPRIIQRPWLSGLRPMMALVFRRGVCPVASLGVDVSHRRYRYRRHRNRSARSIDRKTQSSRCGRT